jgi:flagellar basal body-associated protein FliL
MMKSKNKTTLVILVGILVVAVIIAALIGYFRNAGAKQGEAVPDAEKADPVAVSALKPEHRDVVAKGKEAATARAADSRRKKPDQQLTSITNNATAYTPEQKIADAMQERLDEDDAGEALKLARKLLKATDREIRSEVVATLGWIGVKALPELSVMLGDEDEQVSDEALEQWLINIDEIEDHKAKAKMLTLAMGLTQNEDTLHSIVMEFSMIPEDIIVRSLVNVIQGQNKPAVNVAREEYELITGETYTTPGAAEKWIRENVEPDDT